MKKALIILFILVTIFFIYSGNAEWHLNRNKHNKLPVIPLKQLEENKYIDGKGTFWKLEPQIKNILHQPEKPIQIIKNPYPNIIPSPKLDPENPNLKFLSEDGQGSFEVIIQADGSFLLEGSKRGTYNYANPDGIWGMVVHTILDVIPHFINSNYR